MYSSVEGTVAHDSAAQWASCAALCCSPLLSSALSFPGARARLAAMWFAPLLLGGYRGERIGAGGAGAEHRPDPLSVCSQAPSCSPAPCAGATARVSWPPSLHLPIGGFPLGSSLPVLPRRTRLRPALAGMRWESPTAAPRPEPRGRCRGEAAPSRGAAPAAGPLPPGSAALGRPGTAM